MNPGQVCEQLFNKLNDIENLNNGGCGIAAYAVHKALEMRGISGFNFVAFFESEFGRRLDSFNLENGNFSDVNCIMHILLESPEGNLIDSSGICNEYWRFPFIVITEEELKKIIELSEWNSDFNREQWVPVIEERLGVELNIK